MASECVPFAKTGGLADVVGALPKALSRRGMDVRVVLPLYAGAPWDELEPLEGVLAVPVGHGAARARVRMGHLPGNEVPIYFLEHHHYFDRPFLYGPPGSAYDDNLERFVFFSRGTLELAKALGFHPDVIHAHDWQTALVPVYVDTGEWLKPLHASATVFTIHNMDYQGVFGGEALPLSGLGPEHYNAGELEHLGSLNLMKGALGRATLLTTVSPTYAGEIRTPGFGCGLHGVLSGRGDDLRGVLNGIDPDEWSPAVDRHIPARFDADHLEGKAICKAELQREAGLPVRPEVPLFGVISRLVRQKGFDVLIEALDRILELDIQMVLLGTGDPGLEESLAWFSSERGNRFRAWLRFDNGKAHRIEAGADFFLMPSRFEPCGLNQMYSLAYGTLPIVRATGGLADTVSSYDEATGGGTGFVFHDLDPGSLFDVVGWAVSTWYDRPEHIDAMRRRSMRQDFSWARAAAEYESLYLEAYRRRRGRDFAGPRLEGGVARGESESTEAIPPRRARAGQRAKEPGRAGKRENTRGGDGVGLEV